MMSAPVRVGATVRRKASPATPVVQRLLAHLRSRGVDLVPEPLGLDRSGVEVLSYIEGVAGTPPVDPAIATDEALVHAAHALRAVHDASVGFRGEGWDPTHMDPTGRVEVWCHNDFAPFNLVYRGSEVVGVIDWDLAAPGRRVWDVAYAAWRLVPLHRPSYLAHIGWPEVDPIRRLRLFVDAYDLGADGRAELLDTVAQRQVLHTARMRELLAEHGDEFWDADHPWGEAGDAPYLDHRRDEWQRALDLPPLDSGIGRLH